MKKMCASILPSRHSHFMYHQILQLSHLAKDEQNIMQPHREKTLIYSKHAQKNKEMTETTKQDMNNHLSQAYVLKLN